MTATVLGLDVGARYVGVAVSDDAARIALPLTVLEHDSPAQMLKAIRALIAEREAVRVVVGLPLALSGKHTAQTEASVAFARRLERSCGVSVVLWDERLTTAEAKRGSVRGRDDAVAAAIMLQAYLDRQRSNGTETP